MGVAEVETGFDQGGIPPDWRARDDKGVTAGQAVCRKWPGVAGRMPPAPRAARHRSNAIIQLERASCPALRALKFVSRLASPADL